MFRPGDRVWYIGENAPDLYGKVATVVRVEDNANVRVQFDAHANVGNAHRYFTAFKKNLHKLSLLEQIAEAARDDV